MKTVLAIEDGRHGMEGHEEGTDPERDGKASKVKKPKKPSPVSGAHNQSGNSETNSKKRRNGHPKE